MGPPIEPSNLTKDFKRLLESGPDCQTCSFTISGTQPISFLLAQGVDARTIMETLGHSQISLTLNTSSHVLPTLQRDAAQKMNRALVG